MMHNNNNTHVSCNSKTMRTSSKKPNIVLMKVTRRGEDNKPKMRGFGAIPYRVLLE